MRAAVSKPQCAANAVCCNGHARRGGARQRLVGSYEENMLGGRMGASGIVYVPGFAARLAVCAPGTCPPQSTIPFTARYGKHQL